MSKHEALDDSVGSHRKSDHGVDMEVGPLQSSQVGVGSAPATAAHTIRGDSPDESQPPAVVAQEIVLDSESGRVFGPLDFTIPGSGLTVITGRGGSGKTALALCLSGRMKLNSGTLTICGKTKLSHINKCVAVAGIDEIDELDRDVKIKEILTEHRSWSRPRFSVTKKADQDYYEYICKPVFGQRDLPPMDVRIGQLSRFDRLLFRISLALHPANGNEISLLVMDDIEQITDDQERYLLLQILERLGEHIPVVANAANLIPDGVVDHYTQIELFTDQHHIHPHNTGIAKIRQRIRDRVGIAAEDDEAPTQTLSSVPVRMKEENDQ